jgi:hypothetical protein
MPDFKHPYDVRYDEIARDIDLAFDLFDGVKWLQFVGGEIFLNKAMADVIDYCAKYKERFEKLIVETNATLPPKDAEILALRRVAPACEVMISDYGELSRNRDGLIAALEAGGIANRLKKYHGAGEEQHFGGWLDNSGLRDYGETDEEVAEKAAGCAQVRLENMHMFRGKLHRCSNSLFMTELGILIPNESDYVDLTDRTLTRERKRDIICGFYKYPRKSCRYCRWKDGDDPNALRYPAAEQLPREGVSRYDLRHERSN